VKRDNREVLDYIEDILDSIVKIEQFTFGLSKEEFIKDDKTIFAVTRAFEIIGEAAKMIPQTMRNKYPSIPWKLMTGMRDKLIHHYFGVDVYVLEKTTREDIPVLKIKIEKMIKDIRMNK